MNKTGDNLPISFSRARRWSLTTNTLVAIAAMSALVVMINYLAARHYLRWSWSSSAQGPLSPFTLRVLEATTNDVRVTLYFDRTEPTFEMCLSLLKNYANANRRITLDVVDYLRDPGAAQLVKSRYKLSESNNRDLVIFDCKGPRQPNYVFVSASELSEYDMKPLLAQESQEIRRTHFKGELLFTSSLLKVIKPRLLKAYFLDGHREHSPDASDSGLGYSQFADVLAENAIKWEKLRLEGPGDVPSDCDLLIVAGPALVIAPETVEKIDRYLKQGGRLLALFNAEGVLQPSGLEKVLSTWGVVVGRDVVFDAKNAVGERDIVIRHFGPHPIVKAFVGSGLHFVLPRSVTNSHSSGADAPQVEILAMTGTEGRIVTDVRPDGSVYPLPSDFIGQVPVAAAIEKGGIRNVSADRGATRIVVVGDSYCFRNGTIDSAANREFATHALNWLLARDDFLVQIPPKPIKEYKITMTKSQLSGAQWILLVAFPGTVIFLGWLVWLRRRR